MPDFKSILGETKSQLKGMLTKESSQEQIALITELDKKLDSLNEAFDSKNQELESMKDNLIEAVKSTGFKVNNSQQDEIEQNPRSMDDILNEELSKITAKK